MGRQLVVLGATTLAALALAYYTRQHAQQGRGLKKLRDFRVARVLKVTDTEIAVLGHFYSDRQKRAAVLVVQKTPLDPSDLLAVFRSISLHEVLTNDIYSTYLGDVSRDFKPYKVNLIYPATETHVRKHTDQSFHMVVETQRVYEQITRPYIESIPAEKIEWVYNILEHKTESERIIFEDPDPATGFILLPDFKWSDTSNRMNVILLYRVVAARVGVHACDRERSLDSLASGPQWLAHPTAQEHPVHSPTLFSLVVVLVSLLTLPFPRNVRSDASLAAMKEKFGVRSSSLRIYVHYQPTYYHFHVHFSHVKMNFGTFAGKAVLLEDIISNLTHNGAHYETATLSFVVGEMQHKPLYDLFVQHKLLGH